LLTGNSIVYGGDPLKDFSNMGFLNRFVHKNPKKPNKQFEFQRKTRMRKSISERAFIYKTATDVPDDERFFYKFFVDKADRAPKTKREDEELGLEDAADAIVEAEMARLGFDPDDYLDFDYSDDSEKEEEQEDDDDKVEAILPSAPIDDDDDDSEDDVEDEGGGEGEDWEVAGEELFEPGDEDDELKKGKKQKQEPKKKKKKIFQYLHQLMSLKNYYKKMKKIIKI